ncbi:MAG: hypothetical protein VX965_03290, partial [Candidatus Thermoplasmatota archaeon]|nr:hypothetical protein [Candidatus Thermoplasmatota archaeon]
SKDPTKFQVIVTPGGEPLEYNGELSAGDPIMLVAEFTLPSPEEREANKRALEAELEAASRSFDDIGNEPKVDEEALAAELSDEEPVGEGSEEAGEPEVEDAELPSAPDLDALAGED